VASPKPKWEKQRIKNKGFIIPENYKSVILPSGDIYMAGGLIKGKV
jgi:hypothetical protein